MAMPIGEAVSVVDMMDREVKVKKKKTTRDPSGSDLKKWKDGRGSLGKKGGELLVAASP